MRRLRTHILLLAVAVLFAACDPHEFPVSGKGDALHDFSLNLQFDDLLPDYKLIDISTRAGAVVEPRYTVLLYRCLGESALGPDPEYSYTFKRRSVIDLDTTIFLAVDPARYRVAGWVDWVDDAPYYDLSDPMDIVFPQDYSEREYARDAFAFTTDYDVSDKIVAGEVFHKTVTLQRPVAQLRFVAHEALTFLSDMNMAAAEMTATLRYTNGIPDGYNLLLGTATKLREGVLLTAVPYMDTTGDLVFVSDFLFSTDEGTTESVDFTLKDAAGNLIAAFTGEVPLRRAHATTVTFLYDSSSHVVNPGGINISPEFDEEIEVPI